MRQLISRSWPPQHTISYGHYSIPRFLASESINSVTGFSNASAPSFLLRKLFCSSSARHIEATLTLVPRNRRLQG
ncbi:Uncharacterized protein TCM_015278 [Theobroma cacao]|uniref:Uncharacterized protein n=1 Tax=Theobroma cacao TaxID=3641 RepID=A0A061G1A5_THECC|nr:Uncharacterized protein TCM_015278 [Theobroma cacao]